MIASLAPFLISTSTFLHNLLCRTCINTSLYLNTRSKVPDLEIVLKQRWELVYRLSSRFSCSFDEDGKVSPSTSAKLRDHHEYSAETERVSLSMQHSFRTNYFVPRFSIRFAWGDESKKLRHFRELRGHARSVIIPEWRYLGLTHLVHIKLHAWLGPLAWIYISPFFPLSKLSLYFNINNLVLLSSKVLTYPSHILHQHYFTYYIHRHLH